MEKSTQENIVESIKLIRELLEILKKRIDLLDRRVDLIDGAGETVSKKDKS